MAESTTARFGLRRWSAGTDTPTRTEIDNSFGQIEALGAIILPPGTLGARPAAGTAGRFYFTTDTLTLFLDTGAAWQTVGGRDLPPPGTIEMTLAAAAPAGYLLLQGQNVSRATYAALFAAGGGVAGWQFGLPGGAGGTDFTLPDMRDMLALGANPLPALGGTIPTHIHNLSGDVTAHAGATGSESAVHTHSATTGGQSADHTHTTTTGTESADHAHGFGTGGASVGHSHSGGTGGATNPGGMGHTHVNTAFGAGQESGLPDHNLEHGHDFATGGASADHSHSGNTAGRSVVHTHTGTSAGASSGHTHGVTTGNPSAVHTHDKGHGHLDNFAVDPASGGGVQRFHFMVKT